MPSTGTPKRSIGSATTPTKTAFNSHSQDQYGESQSTVPYYVDTRTANRNTGQDQEVANETAATLLKTPINTPGDALHLLLEASGRTESFQRQDSGLQRHQALRPSVDTQSFRRSSPISHQRSQIIDPAIAADIHSQAQIESPEVAGAIKAWSRLRFVRAGWFTAREAISYID